MALNLDRQGFAQWVAKLERAAGENQRLLCFQNALADRMAYFSSRGCRLSDHCGASPPESATEEAAVIFEKVIQAGYRKLKK